MSKRITVDQLFNLLSDTNNFFSVEFERRTTRPNGTAVAGDLRRMLCRANVQNYKLGVIPDGVRAEEDFRCGVFTVWSVDVYQRLYRQNLATLGHDEAHNVAGWNAWRRIDLVTIRNLSLLPNDDLPPDIIRNMHQITNAFRLANMPRTAI